VAPEFYLIIFLMVAMLVYSYFYSERAQRRRAANKQPKPEEASSEIFEA
jgi:preprotein translocase subunit YajC